VFEYNQQSLNGSLKERMKVQGYVQEGFRSIRIGEDAAVLE
jgi:hypothetical protein